MDLDLGQNGFVLGWIIKDKIHIKLEQYMSWVRSGLNSINLDLI